MMPSDNHNMAYISNALDFFGDSEKREFKESEEIGRLKRLGLEVVKLDLRNYFGKKKDLEREMENFGGFWVRGGNVFVLRKAMNLSGFDDAIRKIAASGRDVLYGGYSAGACIVSSSLRGLELMDDPSEIPYEGEKRIIWGGLDFVDYSIIPHYESPEHPESKKASEAVKYLAKRGLPFVALRDNDDPIVKEI
jgi:dipeptidase E